MSYFLQGTKIFLREVRQSDVNERYYSWLNDPEVNQYLETRYIPRSLDNISEFVRQMDGNNNEVLLAICDLEKQLHIGNIKLGPINWIHRTGDISLLIGDKDFWGKGIATEAIDLVTKFAFHTLNLRKLRAGCYSNNIGSMKAFLKVGFKKEAELEECWEVDGHFQNEILLGLLRRNYEG